MHHNQLLLKIKKENQNNGKKGKLIIGKKNSQSEWFDFKKDKKDKKLVDLYTRRIYIPSPR